MNKNNLWFLLFFALMCNPSLSQSTKPLWQQLRNSKFHKPIAKIDVIPGTDEKGKKAKFEVLIITQEYSWKYKETVVNSSGESMQSILYHLKGWMERCTDLIAIGTASVEGMPVREQIRSRDRSNRLVALLRPVVADMKILPKLHSVNLGKFIGSCAPCSQQQSKYQRRVIVAGIVKKDSLVNVTQAFRNALESDDLLDFNLDDYSLGSEASFRVVRK